MPNVIHCRTTGVGDAPPDPEPAAPPEAAPPAAAPPDAAPPDAAPPDELAPPLPLAPPLLAPPVPPPPTEARSRIWSKYRVDAAGPSISLNASATSVAELALRAARGIVHLTQVPAWTGQ